KGEQAAEAPASVSGLQCRLVAGFAAAAGGVAAAGPLVLSNRPVASPDRRRKTAPRSRLLARRSRESAPQRTAPAEDDIEFGNGARARVEMAPTHLRGRQMASRPARLRLARLRRLSFSVDGARVGL